MITYNTSNSIPNIWVNRQVNAGLIKPFFKWYECGILGCGTHGVPLLDLSPWLPLPTNCSDIIADIEGYLSSSGHQPGGGSCLLPSELNGYEFFTHYQYWSERYISKEQLAQFKTVKEYNAWVIDNLGQPLWQNAIILRGWATDRRNWVIKHTDGNWMIDENAAFPLWVESMRHNLFDRIGRIMIYRNVPGHGVPIHRDYPATGGGHRAHFVNIQLTNPNRPAFVYDEVTHEKIYTSSHAYMFNESDCHGVDREDDANFTIRIDGTFKPEVCEALGLRNGLVFSEDSPTITKFNNLRVVEP